MAKQTGLYNIRGKVNGYSYYKQTGVDDTIFRRINEAMSGRVKTDDAFANTRLNNIEFAQACRIAGLFGKMVTPKYRPMILPFSQSNMAKSLLGVIKSDPTQNAAWGYRGLDLTNGSLPIDVLSNQSKLAFDDYISECSMLHTTPSAGSVSMTATFRFQEGIVDKLSTFGADGVDVRVVTWNLFYSRPVAAQHTGAGITLLNSGAAVDSFTTYTQESEISVNGRYPLRTPQGATYCPVGVVIIMPFRTVGGVKHIMQEACAFKAFNVVED